MKRKNIFSHLFFPHQSNNHRAKILHIDAMVLYLLVFTVLNLVLRFASQTYPDVLGYATDIRVEKLLEYTNIKRQEAGLAPLALNITLSQAASKKAADMFSKNYWAHISPDGKTPWDFIVGSGYKYSVAGENLAKNFQDSSGVVDAWMNSPSHKDNLLKSNYKEVGFAIVNGKLLGEETTLVVQMFGTRPQGAVSDSRVSVPAAPIVAQVQAADGETPVVVPEVASATEIKTAEAITQIPFASVLNLPRFDIVTVRRDIMFLFGGMMVGVLLLDLWIARRKRTLRAVGSSFAHLLFFIAIMISSNMVLHGSIV